MELGKGSEKGLVPRLSTPSTDCTEPMDTDNDALREKDREAATTKIKDRKSSKASTSNFSQSFPSRTPSSFVGLKQEKEIKEEDIGKEDSKKQDFKKTLINESKMELEPVKVGAKSQKMVVSQTAKSSRPSSTPPSDAGKIE